MLLDTTANIQATEGLLMIISVINWVISVWIQQDTTQPAKHSIFCTKVWTNALLIPWYYSGKNVYEISQL